MAPVYSFVGYLKLITLHTNPFLTLQGEIMSFGRLPPVSPAGKPIGPASPTSGDTKENTAARSTESIRPYLQEYGPSGRVSGGPAAAGRAAVPGAVQTPTVYSSQEPPSYQAVRVAQAAVDTARQNVDQVQVSLGEVVQEYNNIQGYLNHVAQTKTFHEDRLGAVLREKEKVTEKMEIFRDKYPTEVDDASYLLLTHQETTLQNEAEAINKEIELGENIPTTLQSRMNNLEGRQVELRVARDRFTNEVNTSIAILNAAVNDAHADSEQLRAKAHPQPPQG
jgi:hypothetical protein